MDHTKSPHEDLLIMAPQIAIKGINALSFQGQKDGVDNLNDIVVAKFAKRTPQFSVIKKGGKLS